jgi:cobalt-zinc-cadmium efflux system outer membrane protein
VKAFFLTSLLIFFISISFASPFAEDTLRLSQKEAEGLFLNNNLDLLARKLSIQQAEAQIIQAKLWPNPEFSIDELNLWATKNQLSSGETIPPLFGNFGKNREFTAELTQVIETAGKRKKRIELETVSRDMASEYFSELIRNLKTELRKNLFELAYHQSFLSVLTGQDNALGSLLLSFENQYAQGNLNKPELFRLKALKLELNQQILEAQREVHAAQKALSILLNLPSSQYLVVQNVSSPNLGILKTLSLDNLISTAGSVRPDAKISFLQQTWAEKNYDLEYAKRKPDLTFGMNYDRGGNFLLNFFGFGFKMDLPVFNRNQGAILGSKIGIDKSKVESEQKIKGIEAEVAEAFRNLQKSVNAYRNLDPVYGQDLDQVFQTYTRYYTQRQIGMVEYLDFFEAYISNKRTILLMLKQLQDSQEELSFAIGAEIE